MISKEIVIKTIHQFFYEQIEKTPLITDEDGEHYITAKVEPFLEMNKGLSELIKSIPEVEAMPVRHAYMLSDEDGNIQCSECGSGECWGNYCMNCGARMEAEDEDN